MADMRNDSSLPHLSGLAATKSNSSRDSNKRVAIRRSHSNDDRKDAATNLWDSPRLMPSTTMDNSNLGTGMYASPPSSQGSPRKVQLMTEKEVSSLVHSALIRARQATKSFSPRSRSTRSLGSKSVEGVSPSSSQSSRQTIQSQSLKSPGASSRLSVRSPSSLASPNSRPPIHSLPSSPSKRAIAVPSLTNSARRSKESPKSNAMRSPRTAAFSPTSGILRSSVSHASTSPKETGGAGDILLDDFHTPTLTSAYEEGREHRTTSSSQELEGEMREHLSIDSPDEGSTASSGSVNSSEDIIKRVEEEIANARKAAQEATRRLAGVSANFMAELGSNDSRSLRSGGSVGDTPTVSYSHSKKDYDDNLDEKLEEAMVSSASDDDGNFDSALNLIGEEFDEIIACRSETSEPSMNDPKPIRSTRNHSKSFFDESDADEKEELDGAESIENQETEEFVRTCSEELDNLLRNNTHSLEETLGLASATDDNEENNAGVIEEKTSDANQNIDQLSIAGKGSLPIGNGTFYSEGDVSIERVLSEKVQDSVHSYDSNDINQILSNKSEKSNAKLEKFVRTRSIEECTLDDAPADELETLVTEGLAVEINEAESIEKMKGRIIVNKSSDDIPLDELEAVLSDEKEQDRIQMKMEIKNSESVSVADEITDDVDDSIGPVQSQPDQLETISKTISQENNFVTASLSTFRATMSMKSQDHEDLDKKPLGRLPVSPRKLTEDTASSDQNEFGESDKSIENAEESTDTTEVIEGEEKSRIETESGNEYTEPEEQNALDDGIPGFENPTLTNGSDDVNEVNALEETNSGTSLENYDSPEIKEEQSATDTENFNIDQKTSDEIIKDLEKETATKIDSTGDDAIDDDQEVSGDQVTDVVDNRVHLTNRLLNNLTAGKERDLQLLHLKESLTSTGSYNKTPPHELQPKTNSVVEENAPPPELQPKTTFVIEENNDASSNGTKSKVRFKQRYPIPSKMKKSRQASEIIFDNQCEKPSMKLWFSIPKKDLKELLEAVTGTSMQRRSNACGALKVLSTQKKNKMTLVRTQGFMDALVFAISDNFSIDESEAGIASRTRAINVVLNVSTQKDNRYHVVSHLGLLDSIVKCMMEDKDKARELACATLATLAKSQECREPMTNTEKLIDVLAIVLKGDDPSMFNSDRQTYLDEEKTIDYSGDDEMSRVISESYSSASSASTNSSYGDHSMESQKDDPEVVRRTRMNACAALLHLSKECSISQYLCASDTLLFCLIAGCKEVDNPIHTKCLEIFANMTRFPHNNAHLIEYPGLIDTLIMTGSHNDESDRLWSMRILQNLSSEQSAKSILASVPVLELLNASMMREQVFEQLAATSTIYNISTEPGAVVPLTNTKNVVATLVHVAHSPMTNWEVRSIACDALATLGLWLQTLAGAGTVPEGVKSIPLPTYITSGWERWEK